jgi:aromatic ring-opening dioxygenase catalytic subunit (LigB family)
VFQLIYTLQPYKEQSTEFFHLDLNFQQLNVEDVSISCLNNNQDRMNLMRAMSSLMGSMLLMMGTGSLMMLWEE